MKLHKAIVGILMGLTLGMTAIVAPLPGDQNVAHAACIYLLDEPEGIDSSKPASLARNAGKSSRRREQGWLCTRRRTKRQTTAHSDCDWIRSVLEGITFIGPSASIIRLMGDKIAARKQMKAAGI